MENNSAEGGHQALGESETDVEAVAKEEYEYRVAQLKYEYRVAQQRRYESVGESYRHDTNECCWEWHRHLILVASVLLGITGAFFTQSGVLRSLSPYIRLGVFLSWLLYLASMCVGFWFFWSEEKFFTEWTDFSSNIAVKYSDATIPIDEINKDVINRGDKKSQSSRRWIGTLQAWVFVVGGCVDLALFATLVFQK
jgi:hypothetical protein